ncbi:hypothetical protein PHLCEN_2v7465 [Hermanssonia centrifuga]|uniref:Uncharacterized protein n=1 Tax=Hermanssonia centrifuga TaxID=98765 RepID=A0A2R6NWE3_9APHY|nr:hypothetical protein PHLCEN_2v7465 [Hermanssonia centrifuga]
MSWNYVITMAYRACGKQPLASRKIGRVGADACQSGPPKSRCIESPDFEDGATNGNEPTEERLSVLQTSVKRGTCSCDDIVKGQLAEKLGSATGRGAKSLRWPHGLSLCYGWRSNTLYHASVEEMHGWGRSYPDLRASA